MCSFDSMGKTRCWFLQRSVTFCMKEGDGDSRSDICSNKPCPSGWEHTSSDQHSPVGVKGQDPPPLAEMRHVFFKEPGLEVPKAAPAPRDGCCPCFSKKFALYLVPKEHLSALNCLSAAAGQPAELLKGKELLALRMVFI